MGAIMTRAPLPSNSCDHHGIDSGGTDYYGTSNLGAQPTESDAMTLPTVQITATSSEFQSSVDDLQATTYCPITHSSLAHPRADLRFSNHVSITFIKDVNFCPTCGASLRP
jgi:hypothetical protein